MQGDANSQLRLPAVLDLAAAGGLLDAMRHASPVAKIDASAVAVLTLPCIQIILSALKTQPGMTIEAPSEAFIAAFADLSLDWRQDERAALPAGETVAQECEIPTAPAMPTGETPMPIRILTIDDSKTIRDMLNLTLSEAGFEVLQAVDGQDGVDMLAKERVDIVITDINMPKMDGYGVIRHMRERPEFKRMPILVLTTESDTEKRNVARQAGATGWLVKPFDPERLIATINKVAP